MFRAGLFSLLMFFGSPLWSAEVIVSFDSSEQSDLYHELLKEYRCLKCQNQNLADSNASLAGDLRREIRDQILAGNGKKEIDQYLVARYGDFVLYRPPFSAKTAILWVAPFILLLVALTSVLVMIKRQRKRSQIIEEVENEQDALFNSRLEKAKKLLND
ncbi:MAG: cytochrome c-type biogenesis protein CcmH [Granulosicoccus sp.]